MRVSKKLTLRDQDSQPSVIETGWVTSPIDTSLNVETTQTIAYTLHGLPEVLATKADGATYQLKQTEYDARNRAQCETRRMNSDEFSGYEEKPYPASACALGVEGSFGHDRIKHFEYDDESRTTKVTSGYGTTEAGVDIEMFYTDNGQVEKRLDGNGNATEYLYDGHDRLDYICYPDGDLLTCPSCLYEKFTYDANGNRTSWRKREKFRRHPR